MNSKKTQELKNDLFYLIAYLITSARGLLDEPAEYGIYRLLDTTGRLLEILEANQLMDDPFLQDLKNRISEEMASSMNSQRQREKLDELLEMVTMEINRRL
jgi:hypothetical protein